MRSFYRILTVLTVMGIVMGGVAVLAQGSGVWDQIDDLNDAKDYDGAYALLKPLESEYGEDADFLWRMARHHFNMSDITTDEEVIEREIYAGMDYAEKGLAADTMNADAQGYYGILIGRVGEIEGTEQKIRNSYDVRDHTMKAIELDPDNDSWQHVMGRWHYTLADLNWFERTIASIIYATPPEASFEQAEYFFLTAGELAPDDIRHWLWLGKTQIRLDKEEEAMGNLEKALAIPAEAENDRIMQDEARELLEDLD